MISIQYSQGAIYPLVVVSDPISPEALAGPLYGIDSVPLPDGKTAFAIWHAPLLVKLFGAPEPAGQQWVDWAIRREAVLAQVRDGSLPALADLRARLPWMLPWQIEAAGICTASPVAGIFLEPGMGKTAAVAQVIIDGVKADRADDPVHRYARPTLVVASGPDLLYDAWLPELATVAGLNGMTSKLWRQDQAKSPPTELKICQISDIGWTASEAGWQHREIPAVPVYLVSRGMLVTRQASIRAAMQALKIRRIVIDESYAMANHETQLAQVLLADWMFVTERVLLSGLPAPMGEHQWWTQVNFLAPGLLPVTREAFLKKFFMREKGKWLLQEERRELLMARIATVALFRSKEGNLDIPPKNLIERRCDLPDAPPYNVRASYDRIRDDLLVQLAEVRRMAAATGRVAGFGKAAQAVFRRVLRLRELTSGFIVDETGVWRLVSDHKFRLLESVLDEIGDRQAVIWMGWDADFRMVPKLLPQRASRAGFIWGATPNKAYRKGVLDSFRAGRLQYLFTNPRSLRHGLTLFDPRAPVKCHDAVYFDPDYSLDAFAQSQDRLHRIAQDQTLNLWMLLCNNTIDETIYSRLKQRRQDSDDMHEFLK